MTLYRIKNFFNIFKNKSWVIWYYKINLAYKIPLVKLFERVLLDEIDKKMKIDIYITIDIYIYLNYITDSFPNISHERIVNLSIYI